eukprot:7903572-Alexandrium_andersonii.AAC.1
MAPPPGGPLGTAPGGNNWGHGGTASKASFAAPASTAVFARSARPRCPQCAELLPTEAALCGARPQGPHATQAAGET